MTRNGLLLGLLAMGIAAVPRADELVMENGSRLIGTLVSAEGDEVVFDTPFAGQLTIKQENIASLRTDSATLMLENGQVYRDVPLEQSTESGQVQIALQETAPVSFPVEDIKLVNPDPWLLGEGYKWYGDVSVALQSERGNTDTDEWDGAMLSTWRSLEDRYEIRGSFEYDEANGEKSTDNWLVASKYDRFSKTNPDNYYGAKLRFEYDRFTDLDLRTIVGPHIGRQFMDNRFLSIRGEVGPVWVDEQFKVSEDNDYPGAMWVGQLSSGIIGFGTTLYVRHDGILNFDDADELVLNTTVGLKMPLIFGFETGIEAKYEYDGGAVEGVDDTDETYNFRIGYTW